MIRLYGTMKGNMSWSRVTAGVRQGLEANNVLAGTFDVSTVGHFVDDGEEGLGEGHDARVALCVGAPTTATVMSGRGSHEVRMLMIATNSSWLPPEMMDRAQQVCTHFVAPSQWSADVIAKHVARPVLVYRHGVDPGFRRWNKEAQLSKLEELREGYRFEAVHLASTQMQRKGTVELIHGWCMARRNGSIPPTARLRLICDGPRGHFNHEVFRAARGDTKAADSILVQQRLGLDVEKMSLLYRSSHLVIQPSRGEGFGMVPLEARACGTMIVATSCTGHAEHMALSLQDGAVVIPSSFQPEPIDDGPGAVAPAVDPVDIADALCDAYKYRVELTEAAWTMAPHVHGVWSWERVTSDFLDALP
jgi:glycosyltransferase involved in cell wall biosynthesis